MPASPDRAGSAAISQCRRSSPRYARAVRLPTNQMAATTPGLTRHRCDHALDPRGIVANGCKLRAKLRLRHAARVDYLQIFLVTFVVAYDLQPDSVGIEEVE